MENFTDNLDHIKDLYNKVEEIWPKDDKWHNYTKLIIEKTLYKWLDSNAQSYILNAGSGGTEYNINGRVCHLDVADKKISNKKDYIVSSIENIPVDNNIFDYIICVGSVINYTRNVSKSLNELYRVLKPGGKLILEYERANSAELLFNKHHKDDCFYQEYLYNDATHGIWLYSDKLINKILKDELKLILVKQFRFHSLSAVAERYNLSLKTQVSLTKFDKIIYPFSYWLAHNRITLWRKSLF